MFVRAQATFQGGSGLPEDQYVNTFHFDIPAATLVLAGDALHPLLTDFYTAANTLLPISQYLSQYVSRTAQVKYYNLAQAMPRVPAVYTMGLAAAGITSELPQEVAVCLSLRGAPPVTPRRRGRLYIGPLSSGAITDGSTSTPPSVSADLRGDLAVAAQRLRDDTISLGMDTHWVIRSTVPTVNYVDIVGGWIDNDFDTQRRRGFAGPIRTQWGS